MNAFRILLSLVFGGLFARGASSDAPVSLDLTNRAKPEARAAVRARFKTKGAVQFASLREDGAFSDAQVLFGATDRAQADWSNVKTAIREELSLLIAAAILVPTH